MEAKLPFTQSNPQNEKPIPFDIKPLEGYEIQKNKKTDEVFPNCCDAHKSYVVFVEYWYKNKLLQDKELIGQKWYKKGYFDYLPEKILLQTSYLEYFIKEKIKADNWFVEITNYIDYNQLSFGKRSVGFSVLSLFLLNFLKTEDSLIAYSDKTIQLIEYINKGYYFQELIIDCKTKLPNGKRTQRFLISSEKGRKINNFIGLDVFHNIFQNWAIAIPNLEFFKPLRDATIGKILPDLYFYNSIPNPYLKIDKVYERPIPEILMLFSNHFKKLLLNFNLIGMVKNGDVLDGEMYELEIQNEYHNAIQKEIAGNYSKEEKENYLSIIQRFLANEEERWHKLKNKLHRLNSEFVLEPPKKKRVPKKEITYLSFFKNNEDRMNKFFNILQSDDAIDGEFNWLHKNKKQSLVFCFKALIDLRDSKDKPVVKKLSQTDLATLINLKFKPLISRETVSVAIRDNNFSTDDEDYQYFLKVLSTLI